MLYILYNKGRVMNFQMDFEFTSLLHYGKVKSDIRVGIDREAF